MATRKGIRIEVDEGQLRARPVKDELEERIHDTRTAEGQQEKRRVVRATAAEENETDSDHDHAEHGCVAGESDDLEERHERAGRMLVEPAGELDVPPDDRIAGQVVLDKVPEGGEGRDDDCQ